MQLVDVRISMILCNRSLSNTFKTFVEDAIRRTSSSFKLYKEAIHRTMIRKYHIKQADSISTWIMLDSTVKMHCYAHRANCE